MKTLEILHRLLEPDEKILYYSDEGKIVQVNTWGDNPRGLTVALSLVAVGGSH